MKEENKNYYKVLCKCGHVGRQNYVPIQFAIVAKSGKDAARIARELPRVKHDHKDAILDVIKIDYEQYLEIKQNNENDPYLKCTSRHEQKMTCELTGRIVEDNHNLKDAIDKNERKAKVAYKQKKNKLLLNCYWEADYEYSY